MTWTFQEAESRFDELIERTIQDGPQTITRDGDEVVVFVAVEEYRRLTENKRDLRDFSLDPEAPDHGVLDLTRDKCLSRKMNR